MYKKGELVLIPYPYTDLSTQKRRPVIISNVDYPDRQKLCNNAKQTIIDKEFTWLENAEKVIGLFNDLLNKKMN